MGWLAAAVAAALYVLGVNGSHLINSDDASEMILAKLLSEENRVISRLWVYSSELRVINTQLVRAFLFKFTDNWMLVRMLSNLIFNVCLLFSYAFFLYGFEVERKWFWYTSPLLLIPYSWEAFYVTALMGHYIPCLCFSFLLLGLWAYLYHGKKYKKTAYFLAALLSFLSCLGGIRQILVTIAPMGISVFFLALKCPGDILGLKKFFQKTAYLWISAICGLMGYFINMKVLSEKYLFDTYGQLCLIQPTFDRLQVALRYFLNSFGYTEGGVTGTRLFSADGLFYLLSLGFMCFLLFLAWSLWRRKEKLSLAAQFLLYYTAAGVFLNIFIFLFTSVEISPRYYVCNVIMYVPLLIFFYRESDYVPKVRRFLVITVIVWVSVLGIREYWKCFQREDNAEQLKCIEYLEQENYTYGYATFWNSNVLTELTEGRIEMTSLACGEGEQPHLYAWLVKLENLFPADSRGPVFLLLYEHEKNKYADLIKERDPVYDSNGYEIYSYRDTDEFLGLINKSEED